MPTPGETEYVEFLRSSRRSPCWCRCCGQSPALYSTRQRCHTPQRAGLPSRCARRRPTRSVHHLHVSLRYSYLFSLYFISFIKSFQGLFNANTNHLAKSSPLISQYQVLIKKINDAWRTVRKQLLFAEEPGLIRA